MYVFTHVFRHKEKVSVYHLINSTFIINFLVKIFPETYHLLILIMKSIILPIVVKVQNFSKRSRSFYIKSDIVNLVLRVLSVKSICFPICHVTVVSVYTVSKTMTIGS